MNRIFKLMFFPLLFCFAQVLEADNATFVDVYLKDSKFSVSLEANPTTGFAWQVLDYNKELITLNSSYFKKGTSQLIGSGGTMVFDFTLNKVKTFPKQTFIIFNYLRSWEPNKGTLKRVIIRFKDK